MSELEPDIEVGGTDAALPVPPQEPVAELEIPFDADIDIDQSPQGEPVSDVLFEPSRWTNPNVHCSQPMTKPLPQGFKPVAILRMPPANLTDIEKITEALLPVADRLGKEAVEWINALSDSQAFLMSEDQYARTLARPNAEWQQVIVEDGQRLTTSVPPTKAPPPGTILTGSDAIVQAAKCLGNYSHITFPMWHSGVWLKTAVPYGEELHQLETRMAAAKFELGWMSKGLVYSNTQVMQSIELINFILERVMASNVEDSTISGLKRVLRVTDINSMAANMAMAIYPSGFPLERPCSARPTKCHTVVRDTLRLSKIIWTDKAQLSQAQLRHMRTQLVGKLKTKEELDKYQEEFVGFGRRVVEIAPGMRVRFMPPTIEQYELSGYSWIEQIENSANNLLSTLSSKELNEYMLAQYRLGSMRQYAHWVDAILYPNDVIVEGRDEINETLQRASSNTEVTERFIQAVREYIDDCTIELVAIDNFACPSCAKLQGDEAARHPSLIAIDAVHTFFTLCGLKTQTTLLKNMAH